MQGRAVSISGAVPPVTIALTDAQVARIALNAAGGARSAGSLSGLGGVDELRQAMLPLLDEQSYSHSTFRAVIVLAAFSGDGSEREVTDVAREIGLAEGTTHRYARTWTALGVLEHNADSRRYRRHQAGRTGRDTSTSVQQ
jgi:hypothetical protein